MSKSSHVETYHMPKVVSNSCSSGDTNRNCGGVVTTYYHLPATHYYLLQINKTVTLGGPGRWGGEYDIMTRIQKQRHTASKTQAKRKQNVSKTQW